MIRTLCILSLCVIFAACSRNPQPDTRKPQQAGQPLDPVETAARMAVLEAATVAGDRHAADMQRRALAEQMQRSMKMADTQRRIDPELARAAARRVEGVRSVAWIDHENLFVIVERNEARSEATIDAICMTLEPLGDTLAVVVHLQSGAALNGDDLRILSRNCQLPAGERALFQQDRPVDTLPAEVRTLHRAANLGPPVRDEAELRRRQREAQRLIEASTPEM